MEKTRGLTARSGGLVVNLRGYMNNIRREKSRKKAAMEAEYNYCEIHYERDLPVETNFFYKNKIEQFMNDSFPIAFVGMAASDGTS
jgi:hypothetical protein